MKIASAWRTCGLVVTFVTVAHSNARAEIIHRLINAPLPTWNLGPNHRLARVGIEMTGDGVPDVFFSYLAPGDGAVNPCGRPPCEPHPTLSELIYVSGMQLTPTPLNPAEPVDEVAFEHEVDHLFAVGDFNGADVESGPFADNSTSPFDGVPTHGTALIGFRSFEGYGWMRVRSSLHAPTGRFPNGFSQFRLIDLAYQTDANASIMPGQVASPSAAALFGIGAFAIHMGRRRR